jgi:hypothetical protein
MNIPGLRDIDSSNLKQVAYIDGEHKLIVQFKKTGDYYAYFEVPRLLYEGLCNAPSAGQFFAAQIKGRFEFKKLVPETPATQE